MGIGYSFPSKLSLNSAKYVPALTVLGIFTVIQILKSSLAFAVFSFAFSDKSKGTSASGYQPFFCELYVVRKRI